MDDDYDCECEEDIRHYLHNLDFFAGVADKMKHIALTKSEILSLFDRWMDVISIEHHDHEEESSMNPFMDMIRGFMEDAADSVKINLTDLKDPNFSFTMEPSDLEDGDDDDDEPLHSP
jgi:hypothetical protein